MPTFVQHRLAALIRAFAPAITIGHRSQRNGVRTGSLHFLVRVALGRAGSPE